jgi:hypothetical protein
VDIRFQGTAGAAGPYFPNFISVPSTVNAPVTPLSTVTHAAMVSFVAGTVPAGAVYVTCNGQNAGTFTESYSLIFKNTGEPRLVQGSRAFTNAATNNVSMGIQMSVASNEVMDFTVRFARPQTVRGNVLLPYVPTTHLTGGVTRCAMRGLLIEEQRTNGLRNSEAAGASAGIPGTMPTNWTPSTGGGLTQEVVRTGSEDGFNYIDVKISGTTTDALGWRVFFEGTTQVAALNGQIWNHSFYCSLVGGSVANVTFNCRILELDAAGLYLADSMGAFVPTGGPLSQRRQQHTRTFNNALTAFAQPMLFAAMASGVTVDFTIRIAAPQLELCPTAGFASSYIPTTGTAATRAADAALLNQVSLDSWYNQSAGTFVMEHQVDAAIPSGQFPILMQIDNGAGADRIQMFAQTGATDSAGSRGDVGGAANWNTAPVANWPKGATMRSAVGYSANDIVVAAGGATPVLDTSASIPTVTAIGIGRQSYTATTLSRVIRRLTYYPTKLANAIVQGLTS